MGYFLYIFFYIFNFPSIPSPVQLAPTYFTVTIPVIPIDASYFQLKLLPVFKPQVIVLRPIVLQSPSFTCPSTVLKLLHLPKIILTPG